MDSKIEDLYNGLTIASKVLNVLSGLEELDEEWFRGLDFSFQGIEIAEEESAYLIVIRIDVKDVGE